MRLVGPPSDDGLGGGEVCEGPRLSSRRGWGGRSRSEVDRDAVDPSLIRDDECSDSSLAPDPSAEGEDAQARPSEGSRLARRPRSHGTSRRPDPCTPADRSLTPADQHQQRLCFHAAVRSTVVSAPTKAAGAAVSGGLPESPERTLHDEFVDDVRKGFTTTPKAIPPRWLYDAVGSALFEAITLLPEYYLTATEESILRKHAEAIAEAAGGVTCVVEFGSGSGRKTQLLLGPLLVREPSLVYRPIDISAEAAAGAKRTLGAAYPRLKVRPIVGTYREGTRALAGVPSRKLVMFIGSSLGNLDLVEATRFLGGTRAPLGPDDSLLLGGDLDKDPRIIERAYNDPVGVTAAFARNVLARMNRELGANFDPSAFAMSAHYRSTERRVEIHLVSQREQTARLRDLELDVRFAEGETIHIEDSYKFTPASVEALVRSSGLRVERSWTDDDRWFALYLLRPQQGRTARANERR